MEGVNGLDGVSNGADCNQQQRPEADQGMRGDVMQMLPLAWNQQVCQRSLSFSFACCASKARLADQ
jgi:hypothetical protein